MIPEWQRSPRSLRSPGSLTASFPSLPSFPRSLCSPRSLAPLDLALKTPPKKTGLKVGDGCLPQHKLNRGVREVWIYAGTGTSDGRAVSSNAPCTFIKPSLLLTRLRFGLGLKYRHVVTASTVSPESVKAPGETHERSRRDP